MLLSYLQATFFLAGVEANRELLEALEGLCYGCEGLRIVYGFIRDPGLQDLCALAH